ncbi:hypothetical protein K9N68_39315 (plasmid) [Kovacikia minuta CCNUW1]|uniref:hypothetical protein n=1 Tax=Kovacikia minuta TaxID=2931930 RepID=UPI001CC970E5|nr:hypothetical protein [Kovacikia minuta]UBF30188.1 hypothetical protein K9N68_39315 [Kovacikia minuta CCNUW1]
MSYSDFKTPEEAIIRFGLTETSVSMATVQPVAPIEGSERLNEQLQDGFQNALDVSTEKIRSELIVTPILREICRRFDYRIGYFSGVSFNVSAADGLNGECDFLLTGSSNPLIIQVPVLTLVEAKDASIRAGLGQCIAQMVAAMRFNARTGKEVAIQGAVTTGDRWKFLTLFPNSQLQIDLDEYQVPSQLNDILGRLAFPFAQVLGFSVDGG